MKIVNDLNLSKQADELGVKIWQTPGFLFFLMGIISIVVMTAIYFISKNYNDPEILVIAESLVVIIIMSLGSLVIRMVEQFAKLNKMKNEFISVASHQLRTPVSAIQWETELLLSKFKNGMDNKQLKSVETINSLSKRMARLVSDLLDVARIDQGRLVLKKSFFSLSDVIQEVVSEMTLMAKARNVRINFSEGKRIPLVLGDQEKIKMVVENLLSNAVKYTVSRGKIELKITKKGKKIIVIIKDNGVGIPKGQQNRIFEKFFRSDNVVKYQTEGTGLGLYIAKNIIEQSGGNIGFQSVEGIGSIFSFSLPTKS